MGIFRLLLAISVLATHMHGKSIFGFRLLYGALAVQCFYMISGFYMALVLREKYNQSGNYWIFLQQRCLRLYPSYLIILALYVLFQGGESWLTGRPLGFLVPWMEYRDLLPWATKAILAFLNFSLFGQDYVFFLGLSPQNGNFVANYSWSPNLIPVYPFLVVVPSWTLGVELSFYLLAPFLVHASARLQIALIAACLAARWVVAATLHVSSDDIWLYRFFPLQLGFFLAGSLGYLIYKHHRATLEKIGASQRWIFWIFPALIVAYSRLPAAHSLYWVLFPLVFVMLPLLFAATKNNPVDRLIGELSFPFYLGHLLMMDVVDQIAGRQWPRNYYGPAYLFLSLAFSYLFYRFIEKRTESFRARLFDREQARVHSRLESVVLPIS